MPDEDGFPFHDEWMEGDDRELYIPMNRCNYCRYQSLLYDAKRSGMQVTQLSSPFHTWAGGVDVYMHPPEVDVKALPKTDREKYWKSWYAELPSHCCC